MAERRSPLIQVLRQPPSPDARVAPAGDAQLPAVMQSLRELAAARRPPGREETCEFCGADMDEAHGHVVDLPHRALLCVCRPCYLLFTQEGAGGSRFRSVPDRYAFVPEIEASRDLWDALQIPVGLAFFFVNGSTGRTTAFYPSPAGATESELPLDAWEDVVRAAPALGRLAPDVEALLVRRTDAGAEALTVPIDACYELVGRIRRAWRGIQGGDEVGREVDEFFSRLVARARGGHP